LNVLLNGIQAIEGEGTITIATVQKDSKVHISFADDGVGIPEENIDKVFDPGFTTKGVGVGTGLGLSICYKIIKNHGGEIKLESELGKGSNFTIILPLDFTSSVDKQNNKNQ
jgi:signal transduction histidine kinase